MNQSGARAPEAPVTTPGVVDASGPSAVLRPPAHRVAPRARLLWAISGLVEMAVLVGGPQVAWLVADRAGAGPHLAVALATGVLGACYVIGMPLWRYRVHRWEATERAVYTQRGWLNQERRIAPASRVQTVDLRRGPLAQLFGLASVRVTTASAAGPLTIEGLTLADATHLVDRLAAAAEAASDDAT